MSVTLKTLAVLAAMTAIAMPAAAGMSPTLLIETGPSDNPSYRRMITIKYLSGASVTANYKAYNRREFINTPNRTPSNLVSECARGKATKLSEIKAFERDEDRRSRSGKAPEARSFCIKNVRNWNDSNKDKYLDPIFSSMPYLAK